MIRWILACAIALGMSDVAIAQKKDDEDAGKQENLVYILNRIEHIDKKSKSFLVKYQKSFNQSHTVLFPTNHELVRSSYEASASPGQHQTRHVYNIKRVIKDAAKRNIKTRGGVRLKRPEKSYVSRDISRQISYQMPDRIIPDLKSEKSLKVSIPFSLQGKAEYGCIKPKWGDPYRAPQLYVSGKVSVYKKHDLKIDVTKTGWQGSYAGGKTVRATTGPISTPEAAAERCKNLTTVKGNVSESKPLKLEMKIRDQFGRMPVMLRLVVYNDLHGDQDRLYFVYQLEAGDDVVADKNEDKQEKKPEPEKCPEQNCDEDEAEIAQLDFLDANPKFSPDQKTRARARKPTSLISAKQIRKGTTADGVSRLILRAELNADVPVTFKLTNNEDGKITPLFGGRAISADAFFSSKKYYAFALYTPPETFNALQPGEVAPKSPLTPPSKRLGDHLQVRDVKVTVQPKGGKALTKKIILAQPPVVLVHGLFSNPIQTWVKTYGHGSSMAALLERAGFLPFLVNYQETNGAEIVGSWLIDDTSEPPSSFEQNQSVVWDSPLVDFKPVTIEYGYYKDEAILSELQKPKGTRIGGIKQALQYYRENLGIAATQAIVVGHSMGGILARKWASGRNKKYKRPENYNQGDIDRILTLNSPHFGSELMELKDALLKGSIDGEAWLEWGKRELVKSALWYLFYPERGAVRDLRPTSKALQAIGPTKVPSYAIATSATSAEIGAFKKDPLKHYKSLYDFAGLIFFNNRPLLNDFVEDRFKVWEKTPGKYRKNITERYRSKDKSRQGKKTTALDLSKEENREKYKRLIQQNIEENIFYWASQHDSDYVSTLKKMMKTTIILPFGSLDAEMGDYTEGDYQNLELWSNEKQAESGALTTKVSNYINDKVAREVPIEFMSILRDLIFHQDPNTDAVVRVESQIGGIKDGAHELIERVIHSYSPWDYTVQRRVISLLKWEIGSFAKEGFPRAGQMTHRYMPSDSFVKPRVTGDHAIRWSGMVPSHAAAYQKIVEDENIIILARPVNASSTQLLKNCHASENNMANCAAAKGMNVKGKSSSWGPQVGYIPLDQRYSKLWRTVRDPALRNRQIDKYNKETKKSTSKEHPNLPGRKFAVKRALSMKTLSGTCAVLTDPKTDDAEEAVVFQCDDGFHDWKNATRDGKAAFDSGSPLPSALSISPERQQRLKANPMYVLADDTSNMEPRPYLTADYDLLAIGQFFESGKCQILSPQTNNCQPYEPDEITRAHDNFDPLRGVVSPWQSQLLDKINKAVEEAGYQGGLVTHHGPENQYKASPYIDYPILVFDPGSKASKTDGSTYLIRQGPPGFRDIHLKRFVQEKARDNFNIWPNPYSNGWQWETRRPFTLKTGYDPRDASNLPPYVKEAPEPEDEPDTEFQTAETQKEDSLSKKLSQVDKSEQNISEEEPSEKETELWGMMKRLGTGESIKLYLQQYPDGHYRKEAQTLLQQQGKSKPAELAGQSDRPITRCDQLAASRWNNQNKTGIDVSKWQVKSHYEDALKACQEAVAAKPNDLQSTFQLAWVMLENSDSEQQAIPLLKQLSEQQYPVAMAVLGDLYMSGSLIKKDEAEGKRLFQLAAKQGNKIARASLAMFPALGIGEPKNIDKAVKLLVAEIHSGNSIAAAFLGHVYSSEEFGIKNPILATEYFKKAANQGLPEAIRELARRYEQGEGVTQDLQESLRLFNKTVELGNPSGEAAVKRVTEKIAATKKGENVPPANKLAENKKTVPNRLPRQITEQELELWRSIKDSKDPVEYQIYLEDYPNGKFAVLARLRIKRLTKPDSQQGDAAFSPADPSASLVFADAPPPPPIDKDVGFLGSSIRNITKEEATQNNLRPNQGVLVVKTHQDTPAARAGILYGDILMKIADRPISNTRSFTDIIRSKRPFDVLDITLLRNQSRKTLSVSLGSLGVDARALAIKGSVVHLYELGKAHYQGKFGAREYGPARYWFEKAAERGNVSSMLYLGGIYSNGLGVGKNEYQAVNWYRQAALKGNGYAMNYLGDAYYFGNGIGKDRTQAVSWYQKAADKGNQSAMDNLGVAYDTGIGIKKDGVLAVMWYKRASEKGSLNARVNLAWAYMKGSGGRIDTAEAFQLFLKTANAGNSRAMYGVAWAHAFGRGTSKNNTEAVRWMVKALRKKEPAAIKNIKKGKAVWSRDFRIVFQKQLKEEGVYTGAIDGDFGPATIKAIDLLLE